MVDFLRRIEDENKPVGRSGATLTCFRSYLYYIGGYSYYTNSKHVDKLIIRNSYQRQYY